MLMPQSQLNKVYVNGIHLHYLDIGRGDPVILVHGGGATDYRTWTPVVDRFAQAHRVVVPSLRYHYPNEWHGDGSDYSAETHARDIAAIIETFRLAPAHFVGSSLGATIGLVLAHDYPHLVRTLVLAEPPLPNWLIDEATAEDREADSDSRKATQRAAARGDYGEAVRLFADRVIGQGAFDRMTEPVQQRMIDNARVLSLPEQVFNGALSTFSREAAREIAIPTLLLRGDSSPKQFLVANEELAKCMPGVKRALIPHASHLLHGMNPQDFTDVVLSFLTQH